MTNTIGYILGIFIAFLILIILVPIVILIGLYFIIVGDAKKLRYIWEPIKTILNTILSASIHKKVNRKKSNVKSQKQNSKKNEELIEDAQFREVKG